MKAAHQVGHFSRATRRLLVLAGFVTLALSLLWLGTQRHAILVVHSESERIPWTRGIDAGIDQFLVNRNGIRLQRLYLNGRDEERLQEQIAGVHSFVARWRPGSVIVVDDLAQTAIGARYAGKDTPHIVYSGIEDHARTLAQSSAANVSGIAERTPWSVIERTLVHLDVQASGAPKHAAPAMRRPRVALISDTGPAADEEAEGFLSHTWHMARPVGVWRCATAEAWQQALREIAVRADLVVVGDYRSLPMPPGVAYPTWRRTFATHALEALHQPMMALSSYAMIDGIPMGVLPSPFEQGEVAARSAVQRRDPASENAREDGSQHVLTRDFAMVIDADAMAARKLSVGALDAYYARLSGRMLGVGAP